MSSGKTRKDFAEAIARELKKHPEYPELVAQNTPESFARAMKLGQGIALRLLLKGPQPHFKPGTCVITGYRY